MRFCDFLSLDLGTLPEYHLIIMYNRKKYVLTFLDIGSHVAITAFFAWLFYKHTLGWLWPCLAVLGGILIDLDHFLDYFMYYGAKFDIRDFVCNRFLASGKIYLVFHAWELIFILLGLSFFVSWIFPLAISMAAHILFDQLTNHPGEPFFYFLAYRWYHKFDLKKISMRRYLLFKEKNI